MFLFLKIFCVVVVLASWEIIRNYRKVDSKLEALGDIPDSTPRKMCRQVIDIWTSVGLYALVTLILLVIMEFIVD